MAKKPVATTEGLFGYDVPVNKKATPSSTRSLKSWDDGTVNPMVQAYGRHVDQDLRCKDCNLLFYKVYARKYYKCSHRGNTGGEATDHRKHWPACTKFEVFDKKQKHELI